MASTKELAESYRQSAAKLEKRIKELLAIPHLERDEDVNRRIAVLKSEQFDLLLLAEHLEQGGGFDSDLYSDNSRDEL